MATLNGGVTRKKIWPVCVRYVRSLVRRFNHWKLEPESRRGV